METSRPQFSIDLNLIVPFLEILTCHYSGFPTSRLLSSCTTLPRCTDITHAHGFVEGVTKPSRSDVASKFSIAIDALVTPWKGGGVILQVNSEDPQ